LVPPKLIEVLAGTNGRTLLETRSPETVEPAFPAVRGNASIFGWRNIGTATWDGESDVGGKMVTCLAIVQS
jgi:hypothetical protein